MENEKMTLSKLEKCDLTPDQKKKWLTYLLNQNPPASWLKEHPMAKNVKYLPIDKCEWLIDKLFIGSKLEIKSVNVAANSMLAIVTVWLKNPITNEWESNDGTGAAPLQTDKGAGAIEFDKLKPSAVQMSAPAAVTYAKKDALENWGRIFGRDINHNGIVTYEEPNFENAKLTEK